MASSPVRVGSGTKPVTFRRWSRPQSSRVIPPSSQTGQMSDCVLPRQRPARASSFRR